MGANVFNSTRSVNTLAASKPSKLTLDIVYIEEERFLVKDFVEKEDCPTQFQDCIFYLHEIDSKIEVDIVKRIRNLMGTRLLHFSEFITHVVTHNIDSRFVFVFEVDCMLLIVGEGHWNISCPSRQR